MRASVSAVLRAFEGFFTKCFTFFECRNAKKVRQKLAKPHFGTLSLHTEKSPVQHSVLMVRTNFQIVQQQIGNCSATNQQSFSNKSAIVQQQGTKKQFLTLNHFDKEVRTMCVRSCLKRTAIQSPTLGDSMAKTRRFAGRCSAVSLGARHTFCIRLNPG